MLRLTLLEDLGKAGNDDVAAPLPPQQEPRSYPFLHPRFVPAPSATMR